MTIPDIQQLIAKGETQTLELKKSTGELKDAMHTACAFLNSDGGWLIFGVTPDSLHIVGQQVSDNTRREIAQALASLEPAVDVRAEYIDVPDSKAGNQLVAIHFDGCKDRHVPYTCNGRPYYKVESTTRLMPREMYDERLRDSNPSKFAWDAQVAEGVTAKDLSEERIRNAVRGGVRSGRINASAEDDTVEMLLDKFKLLRDGKITNAAVVLFGKQLYDYPQLMLRMAYFRGKEKMVFIDNKQEEGNFFDLLDAGMAFCFRHLSLSGEVKGLQREEHLEIPVEALREALTNALCHRRYEDPRTTVTLAIFDDRLEISNPGHFPKPLTPENIKEPHGSYPYNLRIAQVLYFSKYLEGWGTGIRRMMDICREEGVPEPEYKSDGYTVTVTFWKGTTPKTKQKNAKTMQMGEIPQKTNQKTNQKEYSFIPKEVDLVKLELLERGYSLSDSQVELLLYLYSHPKATRKSVADLNIGMKEGGIQYNIARLIAYGLLRREGGRKNGRWVVMLDIEEGAPDITSQTPEPIMY
ncbi:MAG: putative DNA binding domain-containing protein [Prevotella sp.]|nr:putative DNA binding domain-containing protein [Prevotella sp.]